MTDETLLEICNARAFRGDTEVFTDLSLVIKRGESVAILGPNGAGKSTLLKLITRDIYPVVRAGSSIKVFGKALIDIRELRKIIGLVSHDLQADYRGNTSGFDVVVSGFFGALGSYRHLQAQQSQLARAREVIAQLGLNGLEQRMFMTLSSGQQRRFLLARALIHRPQALIFDEPTANLDVSASFGLIRTLDELCCSGTSLILATHHIEEIVPGIDRVVLLAGGGVVADGRKRDILTSARLSELYGTPLSVLESRGYYRLIPA